VRAQRGEAPGNLVSAYDSISPRESFRDNYRTHVKEVEARVGTKKSLGWVTVGTNSMVSGDNKRYLGGPNNVEELSITQSKVSAWLVGSGVGDEKNS